MYGRANCHPELSENEFCLVIKTEQEINIHEIEAEYNVTISEYPEK
jgi:hypothetical protein